MLFTFGFVAAFVGMDITAEQSLTTFPEIRAARIVENTLYLAVLLLWVLHFLALHRGLRNIRPTPALFGTVLSILGLVLLAAGALPHLATAPLSDLYQAPGATPQDQTTLVLLWQGIYAVFNALLYTGLVIVPLGLMALGVAMRGAPEYGRRMASSTVALGVAGLAAATAVLVGGPPEMAGVGVFALIGFHLTLGWKTLRLARASHSRTLAGA
jgi:protein-S-isoprenylcysteine O-methyltransferase Ste14